LKKVTFILLVVLTIASFWFLQLKRQEEGLIAKHQTLKLSQEDENYKLKKIENNKQFEVVIDKNGHEIIFDSGINKNFINVIQYVKNEEEPSYKDIDSILKNQLVVLLENENFNINFFAYALLSEDIKKSSTQIVKDTLFITNLDEVKEDSLFPDFRYYSNLDVYIDKYDGLAKFDRFTEKIILINKFRNYILKKYIDLLRDSHILEKTFNRYKHDIYALIPKSYYDHKIKKTADELIKTYAEFKSIEDKDAFCSKILEDKRMLSITWFKAFWYRRYLEGNSDTVFRILSEVSIYYSSAK